MTLSEFCNLAAVGIVDFRHGWVDKHWRDSAQYPVEMGEGDWWEQFLAWVSVQEGEGDD